MFHVIAVKPTTTVLISILELSKNPMLALLININFAR